jgi:integrase
MRSLESSKRRGLQISAAAAAWLGTIDDGLHGKIADEGFCVPRVAKAAKLTIAGHVAAYIDRRGDLGECARLNLRQAERKLLEHFGEPRMLASVTVGDAKAYRQWLEGQGYALATIAMHVKKAKQLFGDAVDHELLAKNPFKGVVAGSQVNADNMRYIAADAVEGIIAVAPGVGWKALLALARYGGLRCPSEIALLTWADVDFDAARICVHSSKTRKQGKAVRIVPMNRRLRELLLEAFTAAPEGQERVVDGVGKSSNLRTHFERLCIRAGVTPWSKPFQNLRLSCETDWMDTDSIALACKWSGNSPEVAISHYHLVRDSDYARVAARGENGSAKDGAEYGAECGATEWNGVQSHKTTKAASAVKASACTPNAVSALTADAALLPLRGIEQSSNSSANHQVPVSDGAESGADDPDLRSVIERWGSLSLSSRAAVVALVRSSSETGAGND